MLKIGYIGLGGRGRGMLKTVLDSFENVDVVGVCDIYEDRTQTGVEIVKEKRGHEPFATTNSDEIMKLDVDAIMVMTSWEAHIPLCIDAMRAGKPVAMEVAGAYSLDACYELVKTSESTGVPCMLLENCCYGKTELAVLKMVRDGMFGDVVHCAGGYMHDLRKEISFGEIRRHYRLRNYKSRCCENYPTHELGPIAKVLNINRGNRMVKLTSVASRAAGLKAYVEKTTDKLYDTLADDSLESKTLQLNEQTHEITEGLCENYVRSNEGAIAQGDIVNTIITCADGSTISLTLDTTLPRQYSRGFTVRGTKGAYFEDNNSIFLDDDEEANKHHFSWKAMWGNAEKYINENLHPVWAKYAEDAKKSGHDGMDYMVLRAFFEAVEKKAPFPIDVYDAAAWMSITALSEKSIQLGGAPVDIPDFTGGKWAMYKKSDSGLEFALD